jgi:hypothetical protein
MTCMHEPARQLVMARSARIVRPHEHLMDEKNSHKKRRFPPSELFYPERLPSYTGEHSAASLRAGRRRKPFGW